MNKSPLITALKKEKENTRVQQVTFQYSHVDVGADLWDVAELRQRRRISAALCWRHVVTASAAGSVGWRNRDPRGGGGEQEEEDDAQHNCRDI